MTLMSAHVALLTMVAALVAISTGSVRIPFAAVGSGTAWYASPEGVSTSDGTIASPLDLATALSAESPVRPGDIVWLRGGTYRGAFTSALMGTPTDPIIVRQYSSERVILDGNGAPANTLTIRGGYTWFWGIEVTHSDPTRVYMRAVNLDPDRPDAVRGTGVNIYGPGVKCINLIVHDALGGFGMWEAAVDAEIYGSLTYHNGVVDTVRGHGHGIYIQNREGEKRIEDVIAFRNHATGMKAYGESGYAENVRFDGVVSFDNGVPSLEATARDRIENLFVGTTDHPADKIAVENSMFYHRPRVLAPNVTLGYQNPDNGTLTVRDNLIIGGSIALSIRNWRDTIVAGNHLFATTSDNRNADQSLVQLRQPLEATTAWARNTYVDGTDQAHPFNVRIGPDDTDGGNLSFDGWQKIGVDDRASDYRAGWPTGAVVRVRPNRYERGRAHLVIYNWDALSAVDVDLRSTGLQPGEGFEIRDAQNYFAPPVVRGVYTRELVSVPLDRRTVAQPVGDALLPSTHTGPAFFVFVILPLS